MPTLLAPAKINLTLEVLGRRPDGYHAIRSVMVPIALYDGIALEPSAAASFRASDPALENEDNLVLRALRSAGIANPLRVVLTKAIPVGGGLGGGSSDAAAILRAAKSGTLGTPADADWLSLARQLGSDVPFFLAGTAALVEGVGERVTPLGALARWWVVVVRPPVAVPTAEAYRRLDAALSGRARSRARSASASLAAVDALQRGDFDALCATLVNDFHDPIVDAYPAIAGAHAALRAAGASTTLLSGSGSCLFALCEREDEARTIASRLDRTGLEAVFVCPFHHDQSWR